jgi:FkbM family methyltransferase
MAQRTHSNLYYVRSILTQTWRHPANRHRRLRAVAAALGWQVHKRLGRGPRDVAFFGWTLRCHPDSNSASNVIYFTPRYDPDEMGFMQDYLRPGDGFLDVGANIGTYALLARRLVGGDGLVVALEPHPVAAARCRENLQLNHLDDVELHEAAVADVAGTAEFLDDFDVSNRIRSDSDGAVATRTVAMVTLDEVLGDRPMALGKLDVEGHETAALRGAVHRLRRADPPVWQIEIFDHQLARAGTTREELVGLLDEHGFSLFTYRDGGSLQEVRRGERPVSNVWAVHRDHVDPVRERLGR